MFYQKQGFDKHIYSMVPILDSNSEHIAQALRKTRLFFKIFQFDINKCLKQIKLPNSASKCKTVTELPPYISTMVTEKRYNEELCNCT